jgi:hypothetical protein
VERGLVDVDDLLLVRHEEAGEGLAECLLVVRDFAEVSLFLRVDELRLAVLDLGPVVVVPQGIGREPRQVELLAHPSSPLCQTEVAPLLEDLRILEVVDLLPCEHSLPSSPVQVTPDDEASLAPTAYDVVLGGGLHASAEKHLFGTVPLIRVVAYGPKAKVDDQCLSGKRERRRHLQLKACFRPSSRAIRLLVGVKELQDVGYIVLLLPLGLVEGLWLMKVNSSICSGALLGVPLHGISFK